MAAGNMNNLTTLIKRLEAATSRLEDMAQSTTTTDHTTTTSTNGVSGSKAAAVVGGGSVGGGGGATGENVTRAPAPLIESLPPSIEAFDDLIASDVKKFVGLSEELGGVVADQSSGVFKAFGAQRKILIVATKAKKPEVQSPLYMEILTELQRQMGSVGDFREMNRGSPFFSHLSAVSEGIRVLGWITVEPKPADYIAETFSSAQFFGNRVLKEYKERDRKHVEWVQALYRIFSSLGAYVKQYYPGGLVWNRDGIDAKEALKRVDAGQNNTNTGAAPPPPPPPPPPPLPKFDNMAPPPNKNGAAAAGGGGDMDAVFAQLNQGEAVTSGLRKVDRSEMTHKNPTLRTSATVPPRRSSSQASDSSRSPVPPGKKPKPEAMRTKRPAKKELDGNKWIIENYESPSSIIQVSAAINQSILISRCRDSTVQVSGKANAISIDNCPRLCLILESLVSSVDVIKSPNFAMQVTGNLPTIMLDQVDGATIYLGQHSLGTEIFTSKCSGVNLNVPPSAAGGRVEDDHAEDWIECPLPEQIKSVVRDGRVVNEIVEHAG
ncbi:MAG: hypothetical protein M1816_002864 [Peltula sp. TS41687]|nr:MAG: hypothetical protein M1816_002864 [Peltula sp. TS41687]